ncbi:endocuticle structural glycoprotein SgAbd-1-like [Contarinia nasturtii]|uniref:endocuticle structural glycoprotein SgAbd-1-like n=1 Tax=Contarinia nasturtii TaxID=265458 RepID=UPI0012D3F317|nr:endocuticle structural glycoprotein SgAbd-1-like [Contarinia nasturtii]
MKFLLFAAFVAVVSAQYDDGSYHPEHHGGEYRHQNVNYQPGKYYQKYYHGAIPIESVVPKVIAQPLSQSLVHPVSAQQQVAVQRFLAQPLVHPVSAQQQVAVPRFLAQPLAQPVLVPQQVAVQRFLAQPLAQPASVPQQVAVPRFVAPSFDVPQQITVSIPAARFNNDGQSQTLREYREQSSTGDYKYEYETENGIHVNEQSQVLPSKSQQKAGFYEFTSPEGQHFRVDYVADENGFHASGAHLPVAPESANARVHIQ